MPDPLPRINNEGHLPYKWSLKRDKDGHRDYEVAFRVECDPDVHGPYQVLTQTTGLYEPGATWDEFGFSDDAASCTRIADVLISPGQRQGERKFYDVVQYFSTRGSDTCGDSDITEPLDVPDRITVETTHYTKEASEDGNGDPILTSSFEMFRGQQVEIDAHRIRVIIEQNVLALELDLLKGLIDHVHDGELWEQDAFTVKFSDFTANPKYTRSVLTGTGTGDNCTKYWVRKLIFDIGDDFNRCFLDEGTKVLRGAWDKNPVSPTYGTWVVVAGASANNPADFIQYQDWNANPTRVILDGHGRPWDSEGLSPDPTDDEPGRRCFQMHPDTNLLLLGIPTSLDD